MRRKQTLLPTREVSPLDCETLENEDWPVPRAVVDVCGAGDGAVHSVLGAQGGTPQEQQRAEPRQPWKGWAGVPMPSDARKALH